MEHIKREEIIDHWNKDIMSWQTLEGKTVEHLKWSFIVLLDIRDGINLLTEQSKKQRVEKPKVCHECNGRGFVARLDDEMAMPLGSHVLIPKKVPCPLCSNPQN